MALVDCVYEPLWLRIIKIPFYIIFLPFVIVYIILTGERNCRKCNKFIWRWQKSVRKEKPCIISGMNLPHIDDWHLKCYIKLKGGDKNG